jgi:hypothetical protein
VEGISALGEYCSLLKGKYERRGSEREKRSIGGVLRDTDGKDRNLLF